MSSHNIIKAHNMAATFRPLVRTLLRDGKGEMVQLTNQTVSTRLVLKTPVTLWVERPDERMVWFPHHEVNPLFTIISGVYNNIQTEIPGVLARHSLSPNDEPVMYNPTMDVDIDDNKLMVIASFGDTMDLVNDYLGRIFYMLGLTQELLAASVNVGLGPLTINMKSGYYVDMGKNAVSVASVDDVHTEWMDHYIGVRPRACIFTDPKQWREEAAMILRGELCVNIRDPWLRRTFQFVVNASDAVRDGEMHMAREELMKVQDDAIRLACLGWLNMEMERV